MALPGDRASLPEIGNDLCCGELGGVLREKDLVLRQV
jgi:hypothetical protein